MRANEIITEAVKQRLDPKCWKGKHKEGTKIKGGVRVNNCVPNESVEKKSSLPNHAPKGHEWDRLPEWKKEWYRKWTPGSQGVCKHPQSYHAPSNVDEDWTKVNKHDKTDGMSPKAVKAYRRENPGSKLKTAVTTKPSKLKAGSKDAKRRKSFCARMSGNNGPMKKPNGKPTPKALALRRWNCESVEDMRQLIETATRVINEEKKVAEGWSKKYKNSINCSNPKGFSQKAHCAGKKK